MKEIFLTISENLRYVAMLLAGTAIAGKVLFADRAIYTVFAIGLLIMAVLLFIFDIVRRTRKKKAEERLTAQLAGNASGNAGITEAARRAQLDALRENFQKGVAKFRTAGKDLYTLPWYMVVGEPGSGKTEAIRRSNVGFPPGLQDEMQGAGGTINMHWWFTNQAILLDTAGKLLFAETPPGTTTEWTEFLNLLTKSRPNCPINGLILVIPADSLLRDNADEIAKKAGKICEQLDRIQRTLDVRFPVFILITKCDLLNGFREFFSDLKDPHLQHQMTGWSNPDELDTPFKPEHIDQYLDTISQKIARRRLGLLTDPVATDTAARRADEVDSLYALPNSIQSLAPRLRRYLETVFVTGEWSAKPLFLRGLYFTSALTEGKALDLELAQTLGVTPDSLPEGKLFERERSFFLRDLFVQKIFKEKGLVTRASNTRKQLKRRQLILGGTAAAGLALSLILSVWGYFSVRNSVGAESAYWKTAATGWTKDHTWNPIVSPELRGSTKYTYNGDNPIRVDSDKIPLHEFHARLQNLVTRDLSVPLVFKLFDIFGTTTNTSRREAQLALFENSVMRPALAAARARLATSPDDWTPRDTAALATLFQLEGMIHYPTLPGMNVDFDTNACLTPLLALWTPDGKTPEDLDATFDATYNDRSGAGHNKWPDKTWSAGPTLRENLPIAAALLSFAKTQTTTADTQKTSIAALAQIRDTVAAYRDAEKDYQLYTTRDPATPGWTTEAQRTWQTLADARAKLDTTLAQATSTGLLPKDTPPALATAYDTLIQQTRAKTDAGTKTLRDIAKKFTKPDLATLAGKAPGMVGELVQNVAEGDEAKGKTEDSKLTQATALAEKLKNKTGAFTTDFPMLQEITSTLDKIDQTTLDSTRAALGDTKPDDLAQLDKNYLATYEKRPLYAYRADTYATAMLLFTLDPATADTLIGDLAAQIEKSNATAAANETNASKYDAPLLYEFKSTLHQISIAGAHSREIALYKLHHDTIATYLKTQTGFPLILDATDTPMTPDTLKKTLAYLKSARDDLATARPPAEARDTFVRTQDRIAKLLPLLTALVAPDGAPANVTIQIANYNDQRSYITERGISSDFNTTFAGNLWRTARMSGHAARTQTASPADLAAIRVTDPMPPLELFLAADPKPTPDTQYTMTDPWPTFRLIAKTGLRKTDGKTWQAPIVIPDNTPDAPAPAPDPVPAGKSKSKTPATPSPPVPAPVPAGPKPDRYLILQFQYAAPLPELTDWPTKASLKLE